MLVILKDLQLHVHVVSSGVHLHRQHNNYLNITSGIVTKELAYRLSLLIPLRIQNIDLC